MSDSSFQPNSRLLLSEWKTEYLTNAINSKRAEFTGEITVQHKDEKQFVCFTFECGILTAVNIGENK